ncbi:MAG: hypothetical protein J5826_07830, partial [Bacteroidales bacterium]|nr:hypothetical protein [Bacteroidales bacterium]
MKNYVKILISFLAIMMIATSCKKDDNEDPTPEPPVEEKEFTTVSFAATVNLTPMQGSVEGVTFKTAFAAGDVIEITNPDVLYEPLTFALDEFAGKTAATFTIEAKVKKDAELTSGSTKLTAALKNGEKYNNGKPFVDVKQLSSLAEGIDQYSYWACPEFTFDSNNNTITLAQSTVFVEINMTGVQVVFKKGNAYKKETVNGDIFYAIPSGYTFEVADLNFEKSLDEKDKYFYKITSTTPEDCLPGLFSIGENKYVYFSKGNLQYRPMDGKWRLAPQQYHKCFEILDEVGENYANWIGEDKWTDLFWDGTWYVGGNPKLVTDDIPDYSVPIDENGELNGTCAYGEGWKVLSSDEWSYIMEKRPDAAKKRCGAIVNDVNGWIILPDDFTCPEGISLETDFSVKSAKDI